jgi:hypothetical protein
MGQWHFVQAFVQARVGEAVLVDCWGLWSPPSSSISAKQKTGRRKSPHGIKKNKNYMFSK